MSRLYFSHIRSRLSAWFDDQKAIMKLKGAAVALLLLGLLAPAALAAKKVRLGAVRRQPRQTRLPLARPERWGLCIGRPASLLPPPPTPAD